VLDAAIDRVDSEKAVLERERRSFVEFRETVRLVSPDAEFVQDSDTAEELRTAYRTEVMEPTDYETTYGEGLPESLELELGPAIADALLEEHPITQRRKRKLLVKSAAAIERRERFLDTLSMEHRALTSFRSELEGLHDSLDDLPHCSATSGSFEQLLEVWNAHDRLQESCDRLIERRQEQLAQTTRRSQVRDTAHWLSEYLYHDLPTQHPVLSSIATTADRIATNRKRADPGSQASHSTVD
jgi:hypothetical protein